MVQLAGVWRLALLEVSRFAGAMTRLHVPKLVYQIPDFLGVFLLASVFIHGLEVVNFEAEVIRFVVRHAADVAVASECVDNAPLDVVEVVGQGTKRAGGFGSGGSALSVRLLSVQSAEWHPFPGGSELVAKSVSEVAKSALLPFLFLLFFVLQLPDIFRLQRSFTLRRLCGKGREASQSVHFLIHVLRRNDLFGSQVE